MGNRREYLIKSIVEVSHRLHSMGWAANHDGNVTVLFEGSILATPTAVSKADIVPEMVLTLDMEGGKLQGIGKPFSEINLHLAAYRSRGDIGAVVHAHPPFATARGMVGGDFGVVLPEAIVSIGDVIPVVRYVLPGSSEHGQIVAEALAWCDVFMMAGNGVLSVGRDVKEAYLRMELLEHLLKIDHYARSMGAVVPIPEEDRKKLLEKRAAIGLGPRGVYKPSPSANVKSQTELLKDLITEELKKVLKKSN
jgi:L-fuculose-phosphate aldolase